MRSVSRCILAAAVVLLAAAGATAQQLPEFAQGVLRTDLSQLPPCGDSRWEAQLDQLRSSMRSAAAVIDQVTVGASAGDDVYLRFDASLHPDIEQARRAVQAFTISERSRPDTIDRFSQDAQAFDRVLRATHTNVATMNTLQAATQALISNYLTYNINRRFAAFVCSGRGGASSQVQEERLNLDRGARRQIQERLAAAGFDPGGVDGMFGPRTRAAIRSWQSSQGASPTGYLTSAAVAALRSGTGAAGGRQAASAGASTSPAATATAGRENLFWQSIVNSTSPADFEAYLRRFPDGFFADLARNRLSALGVSPGAAGAATSPEPAAIEVSREDDFRGNPRVDPAQTCTAQSADAGCWKELANQQGCYVWNPNPVPGETATWTGACGPNGVARGSGTLTWNSDGTQTGTGLLQGGRATGNWTWRYSNGYVFEGAYVNGQRHGNAVRRFPNGDVAEGPYVNGEFAGNWVYRFESGEVHEGPLNRDGQRHGRWVLRNPNARIEQTGPNSIIWSGNPLREGPYVNGTRHGHWVEHRPDGTVYEGLYANGQRTGRWTSRSQDGTVMDCRVEGNDIVECAVNPADLRRE